MMNLVLAACLLGVQGSAPADRIAKACARAFETRDRKWFERHIAKEFVYEDLDGDQKDRAAMLERLQSWFHPLLYRVEAGLALVSSRRTKAGMTVLADLKIRSQPIRPWRTPWTQTTMRVRSLWVPSGDDWSVRRIDELSTAKRVE